MTQLIALIASFRNEDEGQGLAEYALILALIAIVAIVALIFLGGQISGDPQHRRTVGLGDSRNSIQPPAPAGRQGDCGFSTLSLSKPAPAP